MNTSTKLLATLATLLLLAVVWSRTKAASSEELPPQHSRLQITTPGGSREFVIHVPAACDKSLPSPLVLMLHGFGGTALNAAKETGWSAKADEHAFIIAYPEATRPDASSPQNFRRNPQAWNDGSGRFHAATANIDDVAFIDAMIDRISAAWAIDRERIFVTGFSNGASMTFRLGAELSHRVAAIAPVAGTCWIEKPKPANALSLCYITGTADSLNPIEGGYPKLAFGGKEQGGQPKPAVQTFIDEWAAALHSPREPQLDENSNGVHKRVYGPGRQKAEIMLITVAGLGHHWPGGISQAPQFLVGKPSQKLNATDVIWEFFRSHPAARFSAVPAD
jgi:polyhydroxybutyrate depolymerase